MRKAFKLKKGKLHVSSFLIFFFIFKPNFKVISFSFIENQKKKKRFLPLDLCFPKGFPQLDQFHFISISISFYFLFVFFCFWKDVFFLLKRIYFRDVFERARKNRKGKRNVFFEIYFYFFYTALFI